MRPQRREAIERQAEAILQQTRQTGGRVNLEAVATSLGAVIYVRELDAELSGVLVVQAGQRLILVNEAHSEKRQRFSIAHELGHLVLHDTSVDRLFVDTGVRLYQRVGHPSSHSYRSADSQTTPEEEREANQFAAALLMPEPAVRAFAFNRPVLDEDAVHEMAEHFGVSDQAMSIRLQRLNVLEPSDFF